MKIIITEDQYKLLVESKNDKFKKFLKYKFDFEFYKQRQIILIYTQNQDTFKFVLKTKNFENFKKDDQDANTLISKRFLQKNG